MRARFGTLLLTLPLFIGLSAQRTGAQQAPASALNDVGQALLGSWTGEGVYAADYPGVGKKGEQFTSTHTCRWAAGEAVLLCEGKNNQTTWAGQYWWDPGAKVVRYVGANSGGAFDQGTIAKEGAKLVWASAGYFADGRKVEFQGETLFDDDGDTQIAVGATILGGVRNDFRDTYKRTKN